MKTDIYKTVEKQNQIILSVQLVATVEFLKATCCHKAVAPSFSCTLSLSPSPPGGKWELGELETVVVYVKDLK